MGGGQERPKRRGGPSGKGAAHKRPVALAIREDHDGQAAAWRAAAARVGLTLAAWVRDALDRAAGRQP